MKETIKQTLKWLKDNGVDFNNPNHFRAALKDARIETDAVKIRRLLETAVNDMRAYSRLGNAVKSGVTDKAIDDLTKEMSKDYEIREVTSKIVIECVAEVAGFQKQQKPITNSRKRPINPPPINQESALSSILLGYLQQKKNASNLGNKPINYSPTNPTHKTYTSSPHASGNNRFSNLIAVNAASTSRPRASGNTYKTGKNSKGFYSARPHTSENAYKNIRLIKKLMIFLGVIAILSFICLSIVQIELIVAISVIVFTTAYIEFLICMVSLDWLRDDSNVKKRNWFLWLLMWLFPCKGDGALEVVRKLVFLISLGCFIYFSSGLIIDIIDLLK